MQPPVDDFDADMARLNELSDQIFDRLQTDQKQGVE